MEVKLLAWDMKTEDLRSVMGYDYETQEYILCSVSEHTFAMNPGKLHTIHGIRREGKEVEILRPTGVFDKNDQEIYEGYYVDYHAVVVGVKGFEHEDKGRGIVRFMNGAFVIERRGDKGLTPLFDILYRYDEYVIEIEGSVYDAI